MLVHCKSRSRSVERTVTLSLLSLLGLVSPPACTDEPAAGASGPRALAMPVPGPSSMSAPPASSPPPAAPPATTSTASPPLPAAASGGAPAPNTPPATAGSAAPVVPAMPAPPTGPIAPEGSPPEPGPSAGCTSGTGTVRPGRSMLSIESGGMARTYLLYVPPSYDGSKPVPIVVDHHGGGATSVNAERSSGFKELADREGYLWVAPDGLEMSWGEDERDGQFVLDIIALLESTACVDRKRIYSTGCSMGAGQTNWLACNQADVFAAVMPVCGTTFFDLANECTPSQPIATMLVIGRDDDLNCWDAADEGSKPTRCVDTYRNIFKQLNGCTGMERPTHNGNCTTVDQCDGGVEVVTCGVAAGHVAYFATDMQVTEEGWKFLSRFYRER